MIRFEEEIYKFITDNGLLEPGDKVLLGVSGGADSVCLLRVLLALRTRLGLNHTIVVAHVNHMLRGEEADADEVFTRTLCEKHGVEFYAYHKDIHAMAEALGISTEEAGRNYRYQVFEELSKEKGCHKIAVAHHRDDMAETVLLNMLRGSGIAGMAGIAPVRGKIIRPLLNVGRKDIEQYLDELGQDYVTDMTNLGTDYTRNKVRHILMPEMEKLNPGAIEHIASFADDSRKIEEYLDRQTKEAYEKAKIASEAGVKLSISVMKALDDIIIRRAIHCALAEVAGKRKDITRRHIEAVISVINGESGGFVNMPYEMIARKSYDELIIEKLCSDRIDEKSAIHINIDMQRLKVEGQLIYDLSEGSLIIKYFEGEKLGHGEGCNKPTDEKNECTKIFDYDKMDSTVCIRNPLEGDYIIIDKEGHTKKLNRVFIDAKIDRRAREKWPVVAKGTEILWAVDLRYNEAYRVDVSTEGIVMMTYMRACEDK